MVGLVEKLSVTTLGYTATFETISIRLKLYHCIINHLVLG